MPAVSRPGPRPRWTACCRCSPARICSAALTRDDRVVGCPSGHRFDIARQGYLSLLGSRARTDTGDSADMVAARAAFLDAGHYRPIADAIADPGRRRRARCSRSAPVPGYYLGGARSADGSAAGPTGRRARRVPVRRPARGRAPARIGSIVADAWSRLPVRDGVAVGTVLSVFAPRDPAEIVRVLAPGGRVVVVTPDARTPGRDARPGGSAVGGRGQGGSAPGRRGPVRSRRRASGRPIGHAAAPGGGGPADPDGPVGPPVCPASGGARRSPAWTRSPR